MEHTPKECAALDGLCALTWESELRVKAIKFCPLHAAAPEMLEALKAGGQLWSFLPFDSGADIQEVAQRVAKQQRNAIKAAKGDA